MRFEAVAQGVAPAPVDLVDLLGVVGRLVHGHDGRDLDGLERAVVEVGLELGQGGHDLGVADAEPHPPAGHGERLGERVELDGHVLGAGHLQDRRRLVAVEGGVGVGEVVDEDDVVLPGEGHQPVEPRQVDARGGGVVRERQHDHPGPGPGVLPGLQQVGEEVLVRPERDAAHVGAGEQGGVDVDRVRRGGHQGRVARAEQHPHQVGQALLGPDDVDDLGVGVELDAELALVEAPTAAARSLGMPRLAE